MPPRSAFLERATASLSSGKPPTVERHQRRIVAGGHDWHLDEYTLTSGDHDAAPGEHPRPLCLLLHGTGASAASWEALARLLAAHMDIVAPDLPAHARTRSPRSAALDIDAQAVALDALVTTLGREPDVQIGHSAGAVILAARAMQAVAGSGARGPSRLISVNGALLPLDGPAGWLFQPLARVSNGIGWLPRLFALRAAREPDHVRRLLSSTGSMVDDAMVARYRALLADDAHLAGVLRMMAAWDLRRFAARLDRLQVPLHLLAGDTDRTIPLRHARRLCASLPRASLHVLPGLGHLAHEEDPDAVAAAVLGELDRSRPRR